MAQYPCNRFVEHLWAYDMRGRVGKLLKPGAIDGTWDADFDGKVVTLFLTQMCSNLNFSAEFFRLLYEIFRLLHETFRLLHENFRLLHGTLLKSGPTDSTWDVPRKGCDCF